MAATTATVFTYAAATGVPVFRALRGLGETDIAKENPILMILIPCIAFSIVFGASALSQYMTAVPVHIDMDKMSANVTQYCIQHLAEKNISLHEC